MSENSAPAIFAINTFTTYSSSDYNGFRPNAGAPYLFASRNRIDADFRGSASMAGVGRDDGEAALEGGVPKRSGVAADGGRDDTVVAAAAPLDNRPLHAVAGATRSVARSACCPRRSGALRAPHDAVGPAEPPNRPHRSSVSVATVANCAVAGAAHADSTGGGTSAARPMSLVTATRVSATAAASVD
jgi:hypothetical protein